MASGECACVSGEIRLGICSKIYGVQPYLSYLPEGGLAAARTEVRDLSMVVIPALAMEIVCCSMACVKPGSQSIIGTG